MILYYIRHGDPIYDPDSLTELGKRQAEALAHRLAAHGIDRIFASSSGRAIDTARPTAELMKKEITILDWANEAYIAADATAKNRDGETKWLNAIPEMTAVFTSPEMRRLGSAWREHPIMRELRIAAGMDRIDREADAFIESLGYRHDRTKFTWEAVRPNEERVAFFAHAGFGMAFLSSILDIPYPQFVTTYDLNHSGMTVIRFDEQLGVMRPLMLMLSSDSHLYADRLPTRYNNEIYI